MTRKFDKKGKTIRAANGCHLSKPSSPKHIQGQNTNVLVMFTFGWWFLAKRALFLSLFCRVSRRIKWCEIRIVDSKCKNLCLKVETYIQRNCKFCIFRVVNPEEWIYGPWPTDHIKKCSGASRWLQTSQTEPDGC